MYSLILNKALCALVLLGTGQKDLVNSKCN